MPLYKLIELKTIQREIEVTQYYATIDWYNFCRDVCGQHLLQNRQQIGGLELDADGNIVPKVVEIDESKFFHRKYHRGEYREGHWVFGGIERGSNRCFMAEVERRVGATLPQLIKYMILHGTYIISDNGAYTHDVINHEDNFVDPNNSDIHSMWSRAKRMFRQMYGASRRTIGYLPGRVHVAHHIWSW